ncbi:N-acetyltransferase ESCO2 [Dendrobates tinctorius]|uniref:N-acetyltransferase ESCO2 n=1 Tax=Dendrobates tinctorius TaxID=92724 RepID=UPI003CCA6D92
MATRTPRKRKQSWGAADGRGPSFGTPVKKLLADCSVVLTPLQTRNLNSSGRTKCSPAPRSATTGDPREKENMAASPQRSGVARKLIVSPQPAERADAYVFSPVKSPVPAVSFYKKQSDYVTPIERKLISASKQRGGGEDVTPPATKEPPKVTRTRKLPSAKKRRSTGKTVKKSPPKTRSPTLPEPSKTSPPEEPVAQKTAILGLKVKPRPKLMVGAAFFATSKKPHSAPRRPPAHLKFPPSSKSSFRPVKESAAPTVKTEVSAAGRKEAAGGSQEGGEGCVSSIGGNGESEGSDDNQKGPEEEKNTHPGQERDAGAADESRMIFDTDDSIVKSSEKRDSTVYPIFSTPSVAKKRPVDFRGDLTSPVCSSTPAVTKAPKLSKRKDGKKMDDDQLIIDAGQKHFGPVSCGSCGMIFSASSAEDEAQHAQYHQRLLERLRYVGWKKERVVAELFDGKILKICPDDPKYARRKAEEVRELVDAELGFQQTSLNSPARACTYLYVTSDRKIAGCLIAEPIRQAFRVLAEPPSPEDKSLERHRAWRCSSDPQPAICGISRIWVFAPMRRRNIASRLVDAVRSSFIYGSHLNTDEIAFSDPTPDGKCFASSYCAVPDFLVYNFLS